MSPNGMQRLTILMPIGAVLIAGLEVGYQYSRCVSLSEQIRAEAAKHKSTPANAVPTHEHPHS